jgi:hypothetical protein
MSVPVSDDGRCLVGPDVWVSGAVGGAIGLHRCQSYKVMQRKVNEQTLDVQTGKRSSRGNAVTFKSGNFVLTDCNVTGSNYGTATKPNQVPIA